MAAYRAPLAELRFAMRQLNDVDSIAALPGCEMLADAGLTDEILEQAARFGTGILAPLDGVGDREGARWTERGVVTPPGFPAAYREFVAAGWNNIDMPSKYGGQGFPELLCAPVREIFVASNKAFCMCPDLAPSAVRAIVLAASESLRALYVPKLVSGEWAATMNLTEPQAGSDVGALRTRAEPHADGSYRLFGQKIFISFGDQDLTDNIVHLVLARIVGAPEGSRGISLFLVPKVLPDGSRNDVQCTGIEHKLGNHGSPTCALSYGAQGDGAIGWLIGEANRGLQAMFVMMNGARFNVGMEGVAVAERAYQNALTYARERVQGRLAGGGGEPVPIIRHPDVRRMMLSMRSQVEAMRALGFVIAAARDVATRHPDSAVRASRQAFVELMIPVFKGWATETAIEVASMSIQIFGGAGYVEDHGATQPLRDVRITSIYEGTTSIQAQDLVERKLVRDGGAALRDWMGQVDETLRTLDLRGRWELSIIAHKLRAAVTSLATAALWSMQEFRSRPLVVLGGSVPLLRAFGIVAGGWQMARAALAASADLDAGRGDVRFLRAKVASATFYATNILPQAGALAEIAGGGGESVMNGDDADF